MRSIELPLSNDKIINDDMIRIETKKEFFHTFKISLYRISSIKSVVGFFPWAGR